MAWEILKLIFVTFIPGLELRAGIPYGILNTDLHWLSIFFICTITNAVLGMLLFSGINLFVGIFSRFGIFNGLYERFVIRTQKKIKPYVDKYGELGLALFIGVPLPGSGSYTGAFAAYLLGMNYKRFVLANFVGVIIAAVIVTILVLTGTHLFNIFVKVI